MYYMIPEDLKYTKEHEWVKVKDNIATAGITDYAQNSLVDITFVKLPEIGIEIKQFQEIGCIESIKAVSSIYSPLSGRIIEVNKILEKSPELLNKSCYNDGWIYKLQVSNNSELNNLMSYGEYEEYLKTLK